MRRSANTPTSAEVTTSRFMGQVTRYGADREVAVYVRDGNTWVADFMAGHAELCDANTWFRCHATNLTWAHRYRRDAASRPLDEAMCARIEALHARTAAERAREAAWVLGLASALTLPVRSLLRRALSRRTDAPATTAAAAGTPSSTAEMS